MCSGCTPWILGQLLDVAADLEHGTGLDMPRQLRVGDLVVVRAPDRWALGRLDPKQEVGVTEPSAVEEGRLEDDTDAGRHRGDRLRRLPANALAVLLVVVPLDGGDAGSARAQLREVASLVLEAALADDVELRDPSRSGRSTSPASAARSSAVRCSQARYPTRSVAAKTGWPSISCKGHSSPCGAA